MSGSYQDDNQIDKATREKNAYRVRVIRSIFLIILGFALLAICFMCENIHIALRIIAAELGIVLPLAAVIFGLRKDQWYSWQLFAIWYLIITIVFGINVNRIFDAADHLKSEISGRQTLAKQNEYEKRLEETIPKYRDKNGYVRDVQVVVDHSLEKRSESTIIKEYNYYCNVNEKVSVKLDSSFEELSEVQRCKKLYSIEDGLRKQINEVERQLGYTDSDIYKSMRYRRCRLIYSRKQVIDYRSEKNDYSIRLSMANTFAYWNTCSSAEVCITGKDQKQRVFTIWFGKGRKIKNVETPEDVAAWEAERNRRKKEAEASATGKTDDTSTRKSSSRRNSGYSSSRSIDDLDIDSYYEDNRDEYDDYDDAYDDLEDNRGEWDDY